MEDLKNFNKEFFYKHVCTEKCWENLDDVDKDCFMNTSTQTLTIRTKSSIQSIREEIGWKYPNIRTEDRYLILSIACRVDRNNYMAYSRAVCKLCGEEGSDISSDLVPRKSWDLAKECAAHGYNCPNNKKPSLK